MRQSLRWELHKRVARVAVVIIPSILTILFSFALLQGVALGADEITVSAASSLTNSFEEIGKAFEAKQKNVKVLFNFAASGDLVRQIEAGAPVDVFASAAAREMDELQKKNLLVAGTRSNFAANGIALVAPSASNASVKSFSDLKDPRVKKIAIGNPATVPAGMYAEQTLRYLKIWDDVKNRLVFGENVRQVLDYAARGEVDAAMVFSTDARARAKEVSVAAIAPEASHERVLYPIAVIMETKHEKEARAFVEFVCSPEGQQILEKYGFRSAK
ncbi:MAG TPA: molybdate ABC transporter substrate-binding protein [Syntrophorhabdaceae bacterium]|nr:molybdate ABC transporter substrate-binding protein [Syntrophorhabdaceae bacterium]